MLSRNQIRQAALQYLYAASQTPETEQEGIWDILMEPFRGDYCKLKAKAVSGHLTRDYPDKLRLFITRARETADKLQQDPLTLPVRDQLQDLLTKEGEFNAALLRLKKALHEDPANDKGSLSAACDAAQELNTALMQMRRRLSPVGPAALHSSSHFWGSFFHSSRSNAKLLFSEPCSKNLIRDAGISQSAFFSSVAT